MKVSFRVRVLSTIGVSCVICTAAAILVARNRIETNGEAALVDKSAAILSRLEVGRDYVAEMGNLQGVIEDAVRRFPDGKIPLDEKKKIMKNVPVYAALSLGAEGAAKEHYEFRVFSHQPRNKEHTASPEELKLLQRFSSDSNLAEVVEESADGKFLIVSRPVRLSEKQGCLTCHGAPSTSPWGNGRDILGFEMENMKDGDLQGVFQIISSLEPVKAVTRASTYNIIMWGGLLTLVALGLGLWIVGTPVRKLKRVGDDLHSTSSEVASASRQISTVSQSISMNSSTAASSLEETVASLEELSSIVGRNADNAKQAARAAETCLDSARKGEAEIKHLVDAMSGIALSSKKIEEIINVIDDIAFQTNLLALNAAVEAARAGEQGRGFAVVAEAVRGLALKSAEAAREVNDLIKESSEKVESGNRLADSSGTALNEILQAVRVVVQQNSEIASASQEQAQGITQISQAMNQLDQVSQQNASSSEEAAASSEELAAQSESLRELVIELDSIMSGGGGADSRRVSVSAPAGGHGRLKTTAGQPKSRATTAAKASHLIPFGDAEGDVMNEGELASWDKTGS